MTENCFFSKVIDSEVKTSIKEDADKSNSETCVESPHSFGSIDFFQTIQQPCIGPICWRISKINCKAGPGEIEGMNETGGGATCKSSAEDTVG
jgi:hypothetical protein